MTNLDEKLIAFVRKYFLALEIISKEGVLHFQRFRLLYTPWFNIYLHHILKSDTDRDPHDHPWSFISLILWGAYHEDCMGAYEDWRYWIGRPMHSREAYPGTIIFHNAKDFHKITLKSKRVWSLVVVFGRRPGWGYQTRKGWIEQTQYRKLKNEGKLP